MSRNRVRGSRSSRTSYACVSQGFITTAGRPSDVRIALLSASRRCNSIRIRIFSRGGSWRCSACHRAFPANGAAGFIVTSSSSRLAPSAGHRPPNQPRADERRFLGVGVCRPPRSFATSRRGTAAESIGPLEIGDPPDRKRSPQPSLRPPERAATTPAETGLALLRPKHARPQRSVRVDRTNPTAGALDRADVRRRR